ncbi:tyrosine-type recombinase/integrase [Roseateles sp.]|uniref:tyrosine-type recombinase/integrase n=1 Tax=Roseateles sp. TaxID=1971397 RepID=UPI003BA85E14
MPSIIPLNGKWRAQVRRKGAPTQTKTFGTKALAEAWARQVETDVEAGLAGLVSPKSKTTIGDLITRYTEEVSKTKPFGKNKTWVLNRMADKKTGLGAVKVNNLTAERIVQYITEDRRVQGVTASIDLTYLGTVLKMARSIWRIHSLRNVVEDAREALNHMGMLARSNERDRRPTQPELDALRAWFRLHSRSLTMDIFDFILDSCFRPPSEICGLRWEDLNRDDKTILIRDRKDPRKKLGNNQCVPLLGRCMEIIERQPKDGELIFPLNGKSWSSVFPRACDKLGIEDLQLYDLRHEAISRLVESGKYSIPEMMLVTGHKDPKQLMRYTQLRAANLHR